MSVSVKDNKSGTGRRKTAVARVRLVPGTGEITVNKKNVEVYFNRQSLVMILKQPFEATSTVNKFNTFINVRGGGITGQANAVKLGIARALVRNDKNLRPVLRKEGFLTRDPRMVERKKYGRRGARRRFQFSKR